MTVTSGIGVVRLDGELVDACAELCAGSLRWMAARAGAWLSPPAAARPLAEEMVRGFLDAESEGRLGWVAVDVDRDVVLGFAGATVIELTPDDWRYTFMPPRSVSVAASSCHVPPDVAEVCYPLLLDAIRAAAAERGIRRASVQCAPGDTTAVAVLRRLGLEPDTRMALRPVDTWLPPRPPASEISVRVAGPGDVEALTDLALEEHRYHARHTAAGTSPDQPRETSRRLAAEAVADTVRTRQLVAERVGQDGGALRVVGSAVGMIAELDDGQIRRFLLPPRYGYVGLTSVTESARGSGVGRLLVDGLMRWFAEQGLKLAFLHYVVDNPLSSRFWSGLGFEPHIEVLTLRW